MVVDEAVSETMTKGYFYRQGPRSCWPGRALAVAAVLERFLPPDGVVLEIHDLGCGREPALPEAIAASLADTKSRMSDVLRRKATYIGYDHPAAGVQDVILPPSGARLLEVAPVVTPLDLNDPVASLNIAHRSLVPMFRRAAVLSGVLEYLPDARTALRAASRSCDWVVVTYAMHNHEDDAAYGRVGHLPLDGVESMLWSYFDHVRRVEPDGDGILNVEDTCNRFWFCGGGGR